MKTSIKSLFILIIVCISSSTNAIFWKVKATWQFGNGHREYTGMGNTQDSALENARSLCSQSQPLDDYKYYCYNAPTRTVYSNLPGGEFWRSCGNPRMEGTKLVTDWCKPVLERRELDLMTCPEKTRDYIENCHGDLTCGVCP